MKKWWKIPSFLYKIETAAFGGMPTRKPTGLEYINGNYIPRSLFACIWFEAETVILLGKIHTRVKFPVTIGAHIFMQTQIHITRYTLRARVAIANHAFTTMGRFFFLCIHRAECRPVGALQSLSNHSYPSPPMVKILRSDRGKRRQWNILRSRHNIRW